MSEFLDLGRKERKRLQPERTALEKKMRNFERGERHQIQTVHTIVKNVKKPPPQMPLISPADFRAKKIKENAPTPKELEDSAKSLTQLGNLLTKVSKPVTRILQGVGLPITYRL